MNRTESNRTSSNNSSHINPDQKWGQFKVKAQKNWSKIPDSDWENVKDNPKLASKLLTDRYGLSESDATKRWDEFCKSQNYKFS